MSTNRITIKYMKLDGWPASELTPPNKRKTGPYKSTLTGTASMLASELNKLQVIGTPVIAVAFPSHHFMPDGRLRIDGAKPSFPGVILLCATAFGVLRFACDKHASWKHNLHAIALTLRRLRELVAHGTVARARVYFPWRVKVEQKAEQSQQRQQDAAPRQPSVPQDVLRACSFLAAHSGVASAQIQRAKDAARNAYRVAAGKLHPDRTGGSDALFIRLQNEWSVLRRHHGL